MRILAPRRRNRHCDSFCRSWVVEWGGVFWGEIMTFCCDNDCQNCGWSETNCHNSCVVAVMSSCTVLQQVPVAELGNPSLAKDT